MDNPKTKQMADFDPLDLQAIRKHLQAQGLPLPEKYYVGTIARLALHHWATGLSQGEKPDIRGLKAQIDERYGAFAGGLTSHNVGFLSTEERAQTDAIYAAINTPLLSVYVTTNRRGSANRRLIIYLAVKRYAKLLPTIK